MTRGNKKKGTMLFGKQEEKEKMTTRRKAHASNHPVPNSSFGAPNPQHPFKTNPKLHTDIQSTQKAEMRAQNPTKGYMALVILYIYAGQLPAGPLNTFPESQFGDHKK